MIREREEYHLHDLYAVGVLEKSRREIVGHVHVHVPRKIQCTCICCMFSLPMEKKESFYLYMYCTCTCMYSYREEAFLERPTAGRIGGTLQVDVPK